MKIFSNTIFQSKDTVQSEPPATEFRKVVNVYIEPVTGQLVVIYEK